MLNSNLYGHIKVIKRSYHSIQWYEVIFLFQQTFMVREERLEKSAEPLMLLHYRISGSLLSDMGGVLGFFLGVTMLNCIKETYSQVCETSLVSKIEK